MRRRGSLVVNLVGHYVENGQRRDFAQSISYESAELTYIPDGALEELAECCRLELADRDRIRHIAGQPGRLGQPK